MTQCFETKNNKIEKSSNDAEGDDRIVTKINSILETKIESIFKGAVEKVLGQSS